MSASSATSCAIKRTLLARARRRSTRCARRSRASRTTPAPRLQNLPSRTSHRLQGAVGGDRRSAKRRDIEPVDPGEHPCRPQGVLPVARLAARFQIEYPRSGHRVFQPLKQGPRDCEGGQVARLPQSRQVRAVIGSMPSDTVIERRNRALIAFVTLDRHSRWRAGLSLVTPHRSAKSPPLVRQEPDRVHTKFAKAINTYFFPLGDDLKEIVSRGSTSCKRIFLWPQRPAFSEDEGKQDEDRSFRATGSSRTIGATHRRFERSFGKRSRAPGFPIFRLIRYAIRLGISCIRSVGRPERSRRGAKIWVTKTWRRR